MFAVRQMMSGPSEGERSLDKDSTSTHGAGTVLPL